MSEMSSARLLTPALLATRVPETRPTVDPKLAPAPGLHRAAIVPGLGLFCGVAVMAGFLAFAVWMPGPWALRPGVSCCWCSAALSLSVEWHLHSCRTEWLRSA
jgi:hypothetical protein